ncbi:cilia- and flagella-associated protein 251-like [Culex pipiens pallens]|uniref:cilia- and flagella-associated protein 251-like n=1 Tax=Culex pipiens pallens TaxID=42434 RepID=UPI001954866E|nr:cilia- and flagella-associated protein 251-like [Culex pipiens pallens]
MSETVPYNPIEDSIDDLQHRCQPFVLEWIFGFNPRVPLVNLTTRKDSREVVMASGNALIFYKLENQTEVAHTLVGHKSNVTMILSDASGRFVASADNLYSINIWDREGNPGGAPLAIRTIYEPFKSSEINAIGLSQDGRYLVAACSGSQHLLQLWQWTVGNDAPDDSVELPSRLGKIKNIRFCADHGKKNHFIITLENAVIFGYFDPRKQKLFVEVPKKHGFQDYNDSVFVDESARAVSVTGAGMVIVWADDKKIDGQLKKQFLKYLHLKYASINVIKCCDRKLITGDDDGEIRFYDAHMRILYWFKQEDPEPIRTISFGVLPRKYVFEGGQQSVNNEEEEVLCMDSLPRDVSLEGNPVIVRSFIMATKSGRIYDVDIVQNKIQELYYPSGSIITSFDVHPKEQHLCSCDGNGKVTIFDLKEKQPIMSLMVPIQRTRRGRITALNYSPCGTFLVGGAENGYIWAINPATMIISEDSPLQYSCEKIRQLVFAPDSKLLVFADDEGSVGLLQRENESWKLLGKCVSHKTVQVLFVTPSRFLSIGDDRHLVEYKTEIGDSGRVETFNITERIKIEQSAHTVSALMLPEDRLLVSNDQLKLKIFDLNTFGILHTFLGPFLDGPVRELSLLPGGQFITFMTNKNLYIQQLPIDGNPFKYMGMFAHPKLLKASRPMKDQLMFCFGEGDHAISMWRMNTVPLIENQKHCGPGLDPFCTLLPGGKTGCYVKEMLSLFFYNQISPKNGDDDTEIAIRDAMDIRDIPNYMRSIGFHMTQFEEDNLTAEIALLNTPSLTFAEVVQLFLNHRSLLNPSCEDIQAALTCVTGGIFESVELGSFVGALSSLGERIDARELNFYGEVLFPECVPRGDEEGGSFLVPLDELAEKLC